MNFWKNLKITFIKICKCKLKILPPNKSSILIFDRTGSDIVSTLIPRGIKFEILDLRYESLNLFIIFLSLKYLKNFKKNYINEYIRYVSPKLVVTYIDNNHLFFKLKKDLKKIRFISIQNGMVEKSILNGIDKKFMLADYVFCLNDFYKKIYEKKINAKLLSVGSIKNNYIKKQVKKKNEILFISDYTNKKPDVIKSNNITNFEFYNKPQEKILKILEQYCREKNINYSILTRPPYTNYLKDEVNYFLNLKKINKYKFDVIEGKKNFGNYKICDQFNLAITLNSALGYENVARGNKTFFLPVNEKYFRIKKDFLLWSIKKLKKNVIWEDKMIKKKIFLKLDNILKMNKKDYQKIIKDMSSGGLISYDKNNNTIKNIIKKII